MKCSSTKESLLELVARVEKVASRTAALPILQCILVSAKDKQLSLRATNLEVGIELTLPAKVESEGVVAVHASVFGSLLSTLPQGATVALTKTDGMCVVETSHGTSKIPTLPIEEFPPLPTITPDATLSLPAQTLAGALKLVLPAVSTSTIKPELASVFVHLEGNTLTFVATDSFRLVEKKVVCPTSHACPPILIPQRSVADVVRVLEYCGNDEVSLKVSAHQATIEKDGVFVTFRLTDGTFPNYTAIIPTTFISEVTLVRHDFMQALRGAAVFANSVNQTRLLIEPKKNTITVEAQSNGAGETTLSLDAVVSGKELSVSFNLRYLTDAVNLFATDSLQLSFTGSDSPAIVRGVGEMSTLALVMPMNK